MPEFKSSKEVILKGLTLDWNDLFVPQAGQDGGAPKFKIIGLFEKDSDAYKVGLAAMREAATLMWGANANDMLKNMAANSKAIRNGNSKRDDDGAVRPEYENMFFISASNKGKPKVVGPTRVGRTGPGKYKVGAPGEQFFVEIQEDGRCMVNGEFVDPPYKITVPYRGCKANAKVQFISGKSFKGKDEKIVPNQVYAKLIAVQFVGDGVPFGPGATSAEGFDDEDMPTGSNSGMDDEDDDILGGAGGSSSPRRAASGFDDMDSDIPF